MKSLTPPTAFVAIQRIPTCIVLLFLLCVVTGCGLIPVANQPQNPPTPTPMPSLLGMAALQAKVEFSSRTTTNDPSNAFAVTSQNSPDFLLVEDDHPAITSFGYAIGPQGTSTCSAQDPNSTVVVLVKTELKNGLGNAYTGVCSGYYVVVFELLSKVATPHDFYTSESAPLVFLSQNAPFNVRFTDSTNSIKFSGSFSANAANGVTLVDGYSISKSTV